MRPGPLDHIRSRLGDSLSPSELAALPSAYFRLGDVLVLDLPLPAKEGQVAQAYAEVLHMRSVLGREGGIEGELRLPKTRLLWGDVNTVTTHRENGIDYRLDPGRVMWSQGNLSERRRVATWTCEGQTVVDLFAGVGYFSIPLAKDAGAARVIAVEKNPVSYGFLVENARLNGVADRVETRLGDCRDVGPPGVAHRVLMGYLPDSTAFLAAAMAALRPSGGMLHVHRVVSARDAGPAAFAPVASSIEEAGARARLRHVERVKSYGPGKEHVVLDVEVQR